MFIKWIVNLLKVLNSNQNPSEIAGGVAFGLLLALVPANNLLWIAILIITFFLKVNLGAATIFTALFKILAPLLDGVLHGIGYSILTLPALKGFFTALANTPLVPFTKFNNTIVMGGFITGVVLWVPVFIGFMILVKLYREKVMTAISNSKLVKGFMKIPLVSTIAGFARKAGTVIPKTH